MQSWSFTWQDSSPRPTRQGVAFNRPLINYPDSIRLHHASHLHASLYARIRATKSERKAEKEPRLGTLIARTSHYLFTRDLRYRSQRAVVNPRGYLFSLKIENFEASRLQRAVEPRIDIFFFKISRFKISRLQRAIGSRIERISQFFLKIENFSILLRCAIESIFFFKFRDLR